MAGSPRRDLPLPLTVAHQIAGQLQGLAARATSLLLAVDMLTIGYAALALAELQMRHRDGLTDSEWRASTESYFARLVGSGSHPHLASLGSPAVLRHSDDEAFEDGLDWLLSGFAATLDSARRPDPQQ